MSRKNNSSSGFLTMTTKGAVRRIRTPTATDVLMGRGGGINSHSGNKVFREWVRVRKEEYNLAPNKAEKTRVATEVMNQVKNQTPPGRFLQRDPTGGPPGWWVEVDEMRALAKTSQALREGAPQIRAAHQTELHGRVHPSRKRKATVVPQTLAGTSQSVPLPISMSPLARSWPQTVPPATESRRSETPPETRTALNELGQTLREATASKDQEKTTLPSVTRPLMSNREFQREFVAEPAELPSAKRQRMEPEGGATNPISVEDAPIDVYAETPPLAPAPAAPLGGNIPPLSLNPLTKESRKLRRTNSLALSEVSGPLETDNEFVNPFTDENELLIDSSSYYNPDNTKAWAASSTETTSLPRRLTPLRNVSSDEGREDYRSMADLYEFPTQSNSTSDFNEEMKSVLDAVLMEKDWTAPLLDNDTTPVSRNNKYNDYAMPTLFIPWRGGILKRRYSSSRLAAAAEAPTAHRQLGEVGLTERQ